MFNPNRAQSVPTKKNPAASNSVLNTKLRKRKPPRTFSSDSTMLDSLSPSSRLDAIYSILAKGVLKKLEGQFPKKAGRLIRLRISRGATR